MLSVRSRAIISSIRVFFGRNKKVVVCTSIIFLVGIIVGILSCLHTVDGDFERVLRADMQFSSAKVFFISAISLLGGYFVILLSGHSNKTVFLVVLPFFALGFLFGEYACALIARYESVGLLNLFFVYIPFFVCSFVCLMFCTTNALSSSCANCENEKWKPSFLYALKMFGINIAVNFVFIMLIGRIFGVLIVKIY